jgi:hypothetical protein
VADDFRISGRFFERGNQKLRGFHEDLYGLDEGQLVASGFRLHNRASF